jgi:ABC-type antimicrobial peptide transport system ATPase subunit
MKKIKVSTVKEVVAEVSYCESTLSDREVIDTLKEIGMAPDYDEIKVHMHDKVILFIKYKHVFTVIEQ